MRRRKRWSIVVVKSLTHCRGHVNNTTSNGDQLLVILCWYCSSCYVLYVAVVSPYEEHWVWNIKSSLATLLLGTTDTRTRTTLNPVLPRGHSGNERRSVHRQLLDDQTGASDDATLQRWQARRGGWFCSVLSCQFEKYMFQLLKNP